MKSSVIKLFTEWKGMNTTVKPATSSSQPIRNEVNNEMNFSTENLPSCSHMIEATESNVAMESQAGTSNEAPAQPTDPNVVLESHPENMNEGNRIDSSVLLGNAIGNAVEGGTIVRKPNNGRAKGSKGTGKGGAKRHQKILRDNIQGITKAAIHRLARRGGVTRISGLIYEETRGALKSFLENVIRAAINYTENANRKTITGMDVIYALKRKGHTLYGFER